MIMANKKPMDKLSREVAQALACNMSYGKWKALQQPGKVEEKPLPAGWRKCENCGKPFKRTQGKKFCDFYCRERAYYQRSKQIKREYMRKYRERNEVQ